MVWRNAGPDRGLMLVEPSPEPNVAWRLTVLAQRTPDEMLDVLAAKCDWDTAARLCQEYNFNADEVYRCVWLCTRCGSAYQGTEPDSLTSADHSRLCGCAAF